MHVAHNPRPGEDAHPHSTGVEKHPGARLNGCPGRQHIVYDNNFLILYSRRPGDGEGPADVGGAGEATHALAALGWFDADQGVDDEL